MVGARARRDLENGKAAIRELFERIKGIKTKAGQSEDLVQEICRDIKSLDVAKKNLTLTITALKRLVMLVTALEQLRQLAAGRQYKEASNLLQAVDLHGRDHPPPNPRFWSVPGSSRRGCHGPSSTGVLLVF